MGTVTGAGALIAVDGGGSKTDVVVLTPSGKVVSRVRGPGSSPHLVGLDGAVRILDDLITRAFTQARDGQPHLTRVRSTHLYVSGLDLPEEIVALREAIALFDWASEVDAGSLVVDNDLFALLRAGTSQRDAVAVVCGTGINAVAVRSDGETVRFPALGAISGDWGGGWALGQEALWHSARAQDGRGEATVLASSVAAHFGLHTILELITELHFGRIALTRLAELSPLVFEAAHASDAVALSLVARQADEVVRLAVTSLRRLDLLGHDVPVVLGGGVLSAGDPLLIEPVREALSRHAPLAHLELVTTRPIVGAALLAAESAGAEAETLARVREQLALMA